MSNYFFFDFENIFDGNVSALEIKIDKALQKNVQFFAIFSLAKSKVSTDNFAKNSRKIRFR